MSNVMTAKKATVILILAVLGLMIGVVTFFGVSSLQKPSDLPAYIGEGQLAILAADSQLITDHLFVKEAAQFAASAAVFALGRGGGFYDASPCGVHQNIPVWAIAKANKFCAPLPEAAFEKHFNQALQTYLEPVHKKANYTIAVEPLPAKIRISGKARTFLGGLVTIPEKRGSLAELAKNASFTAELPYDFTDYATLGAEVKTMVVGVETCRQQKSTNSLNACVAEWLATVNTGPFLTQKRITLHYDDCALRPDEEQEKLAQATDGLFVFCARNNNGNTFLAHDAGKKTLEERPVEYWFGIDFG